MDKFKEPIVFTLYETASYLHIGIAGFNYKVLITVNFPFFEYRLKRAKQKLLRIYNIINSNK